MYCDFFCIAIALFELTIILAQVPAKPGKRLEKLLDRVFTSEDKLLITGKYLISLLTLFHFPGVQLNKKLIWPGLSNVRMEGLHAIFM